MCGYLAVLRELGGRLSLGACLAGSNADWRLVAENSFDVIVRFDLDWKRVYVSPAITEVLGFSQAEYRVLDWRDGVHPDEFPTLAKAVEALQCETLSTTVTYRRYCRDGRLIWLESTFRRLPNGKGYVAVLRDVTARKQADEQVRHLAHHDYLTGLANRPAFAARLEEEFRSHERFKERFALLALDLDRFKSINDNFGHHTGDLLLTHVANRLRSAVRDSDIVARLGGDEFAVLIRHSVKHDGAAALAGRIVDAVSQPYDLDGRVVSVGVSIGAAIGMEDGATPTTLMRAADLALYRAKSDGRNTVRVYDKLLDAPGRSRRLLEAELRRAVECGEFEVFYQPLYDTSCCRVSGFEALVRWRHPVRGLLLPGEFITMAEELRLIVPLGKQVLQTAVAQAATWESGITVAVNLSAVQFASGNLLETVQAALASSGLPAGQLELEITESVLLNDSADTLATLHALRGLGVRIALDDFGTGYSSLRYLRSFPFDRLKIDRSFIRDMLSDDGSAAIVTAVVQLGHRLGILVTAEGIETNAQMQRMLHEKCDTIQGYLIGRPVAAGDTGQYAKPKALRLA